MTVDDGADLKSVPLLFVRGEKMTVKQMWKAFLRVTPEAAGEEVEVWHYGGERAEQLAALTYLGIKTATSSAYPMYEATGEPLPRSGAYSVVMKNNGEAVCVVYTTRVYVVPFCDVSEEHAWREGEGDRSLLYWQRVHREFFSTCMEKENLEFNETTGVVCEEFSRVFPTLS